MIIPYNASMLSQDTLKYKDLAKKGHLNQDLARYELHRVWVVEATLRPGTNHTFKRRKFYVDEDGWNIVAAEDYDSRDQLFQFQEGHYVLAPNILSGGTVPEVIYHFNAGRYFITAAANEDKPNDLTVNFSPQYFTADAVQKRTTR